MVRPPTNHLLSPGFDAVESSSGWLFTSWSLIRDAADLGNGLSDHWPHTRRDRLGNGMHRPGETLGETSRLALVMDPVMLAS